MISKNNVPYLVAGALATLTLLASGVFAVAPYIGFLAPVAALSVGLPFIIGCAVFSVVTIALSAVVIQKNGAIRRQGALLGEEAKKNAELTLELQEKEAEISGMQKQLANQAKEIEGKDTQLTDEKSKVEAKEKEITVKDAQLVKQAEEIEGKDKIVSERDTKIEKDALKVAIADGAVQFVQGTVHGTVQLAKGAAKGTLYAYNNYIPSTESAKGALGSVVSSLKNACGASVRYVGEKLNSVGSSYSGFHGTKVSSPEEQFKREDGSKPSMQELTRLDYLDLAVSSSEQKQRANSLDYLNIDNDVPKQPDHLSIDAAKRYLMSLSEDQDVFYDAESGDEKDTKISSLKEQLDENSKTKIQSRISDLCESVKGKFTSFWSGVQSIYSKNVYNSCALGTDLLHAQHTSTLANVPQEEVINKEAQKPEEQADQKPNLQRDNSINNTEEGGKNKRIGAARRKRKQAQVEQPIVYAVRTSNKYDLLSPECFLG